MVYYSEKMQVKVSKGKRLCTIGPGETRHKLPAVHSEWYHMDSP